MGRVDVDVRDGVARLALRNPGQRNALTWAMYDELAAAAATLVADDTLRVVVLRGTPDDGFAAGTQIDQFADFASGADGLAYERRVAAVLDALGEIPVPVIALVEGAAVGAGLALATLADVVVAERGARFGVPIIHTLGNCVPTPVLSRLRARVGPGITDRMVLTGELIEAELLTGSGFVTDLVDPGGLDEAGDRLVRRISRAAPLSVRALKLSMRRLDAALPTPTNDDLIELCYGSADFAEGVRTFLNKSRPTWSGR